MSRVLLFWIAFILTRPLGATVGDLLDKPLEHGGLALSRHLPRQSLRCLCSCSFLSASTGGQSSGGETQTM